MPSFGLHCILRFAQAGLCLICILSADAALASLYSVKEDDAVILVRCRFSYRVDVKSPNHGDTNYGSGDAICNAGEKTEVEFISIVAVNRQFMSRTPFSEEGRVDVIGFGLSLRGFLESILQASPTGQSFSQPNSPVRNTILRNPNAYQNELMAEIFQSQVDEGFAFHHGFGGWVLSVDKLPPIYNPDKLSLSPDCANSQRPIHVWESRCFRPQAP